MKNIVGLLAMVLVLLGSSSAFAEDSWDQNELGVIFVAFGVPMTLSVSFFVYLTLRSYQTRRVQIAAIEHGLPIPQGQPSDSRKPGFVLIALGLGFGIATYVALEDEQAIRVSIFGLIPMLIGAGLLLYHHVANRDQDQQKDEDGGPPRVREQP